MCRALAERLLPQRLAHAEHQLVYRDHAVGVAVAGAVHVGDRIGDAQPDRRSARLARHARLDQDVERASGPAQRGHARDAEQVRAARNEDAERAVVVAARGWEVEKHMREEPLALTEPRLSVAQLQGGA